MKKSTLRTHFLMQRINARSVTVKTGESFLQYSFGLAKQFKIENRNKFLDKFSHTVATQI